VKTNRQIADECAQAAWSWLCEHYDIPIPRIQQIIKDFYFDRQQVVMPAYRVSVSHQKSFYVPGRDGSKTGEVVIAARNLEWLAGFQTKNTIESWTLQFVKEFTWAIELQQRWNDDQGPKNLSLKTSLNQIQFAKEFFPHLYHQNSESLNRIVRKIRTNLGKISNVRQQETRKRKPITRPAPVQHH
jgi:hypothetical protein